MWSPTCDSEGKHHRMAEDGNLGRGLAGRTGPDHIAGRGRALQAEAASIASWMVGWSPGTSIVMARIRDTGPGTRRPATRFRISCARPRSVTTVFVDRELGSRIGAGAHHVAKISTRPHADLRAEWEPYRYDSPWSARGQARRPARGSRGDLCKIRATLTHSSVPRGFPRGGREVACPS